MIVELNKDNIKEKIKDGLKVVIFATKWCSYCQKQHEVLKELPDVWFGLIDGDKNTELMNQYGIMSFPTFIILKDGEIKTKFSGFRNKFDLMNTITKYL